MQKNRFAPSPAIMAQRKSPLSSLDFFPTPPWATRAFLNGVMAPRFPGLFSMRCWEPASGMGHMSGPLKETFGRVFESDVHDYGQGAVVGSFVGDGPDVVEWPFHEGPDWVITNPPFNLAREFFHRAAKEATHGIAFLVRTAWLESSVRYTEIFEKTPPTLIAQYAERVAMVQGQWNPQAVSATAYCWVVWDMRTDTSSTEFVWIPPTAKVDFSKVSDIKQFAGLKALAE